MFKFKRYRYRYRGFLSRLKRKLKTVGLLMLVWCYVGLSLIMGGYLGTSGDLTIGGLLAQIFMFAGCVFTLVGLFLNFDDLERGARQSGPVGRLCEFIPFFGTAVLRGWRFIVRVGRRSNQTSFTSYASSTDRGYSHTRDSETHQEREQARRERQAAEERRQALASVNQEPSHWDILGVAPESDYQTVKRAYRQAVQATHPDLNPDDLDATGKFRRVQQAWEALSQRYQTADTRS